MSNLVVLTLLLSVCCLFSKDVDSNWVYDNTSVAVWGVGRCFSKRVGENGDTTSWKFKCEDFEYQTGNTTIIPERAFWNDNDCGGAREKQFDYRDDLTDWYCFGDKSDAIRIITETYDTSTDCGTGVTSTNKSIEYYTKGCFVINNDYSLEVSCSKSDSTSTITISRYLSSTNGYDTCSGDSSSDTTITNGCNNDGVFYTIDCDDGYLMSNVNILSLMLIMFLILFR